MNHLNLPELGEALEEPNVFKRDRTESFVVELAIVLYNSGVSLRKTERVLGRINVERSHVAIWNWIQKFGERLSATGRQTVAEVPSRILLDETVIVQHGEQFILFAALDGATGYGAAFGRLRIRHEVLVHGVRNRVERWIQELKRQTTRSTPRSPATPSNRLTIGSDSSHGFGTTAYLNTTLRLYKRNK